MHPIVIVLIPIVLVIVGMVLNSIGLSFDQPPVQPSKIQQRERRLKGTLIAVSLIYRESNRWRDRKGSPSIAGCLWSPLSVPSSGCIIIP